MNSWLVYIPPNSFLEKVVQYDFREIRDSEIARFAIYADIGSQSTIVLGCTAPIFYNALPYSCQFDVFLEKNACLKLILFHHYQKYAPVSNSFSIYLGENAQMDWAACSLGQSSILMPETCTFADDTAICKFTTFASIKPAKTRFLLKKGKITKNGIIQTQEKAVTLQEPDQSQSFYFKSRGISKIRAKSLMIKSSIQEICEQLPPIYAVEIAAFLDHSAKF